jgi:quercetin dioxygenase-like cupin family protein
MAELVTSNLPTEHQDVFDVVQLTRGTALESLVAGDLVSVGRDQTSSIHRHNEAETVLYILDGEADVRLGDDVVAARAGDRILVAKGVYHGFVTHDRAVTFLSIQSPPILDKATGRFDLEPLEAPQSQPGA